MLHKIESSRTLRELLIEDPQVRTTEKITPLADAYPEIITSSVVKAHPRVLHNFSLNLPGGFRNYKGSTYHYLPHFEAAIGELGLERSQVHAWNTAYTQRQLSPNELNSFWSVLHTVYHNVRRRGLTHYQTVA